MRNFSPGKKKYIEQTFQTMLNSVIFTYANIFETNLLLKILLFKKTKDLFIHESKQNTTFFVRHLIIFVATTILKFIFSNNTFEFNTHILFHIF